MGVLFYFNKGFKFYLVSLLVVFLAFALFAIMPASLLENLRLFNADSSVGDSDVIRLVLISAAISLFIENPIYGVGPNMFQVMSGQFLGALQTTQVLDLTDGLATHNSYLQYIVELGMFMGLLIIYEVGRLLRTYIIYRSRPAYKQQQAQLKFIFSIAVVFMVSGALINIHSSIFFILALFGIERIIKKQIRPVVMEFRSV
jgi:O-antigen ligase